MSLRQPCFQHLILDCQIRIFRRYTQDTHPCRHYILYTLKARFSRTQISHRESCAQDFRYTQICYRNPHLQRLSRALALHWKEHHISYVFCPYTLVKDNRTNYEEGDVNKFMDGGIDNFINEYLKMEASKNGKNQNK